jgi:penicillin-binding protein 1A
MSKTKKKRKINIWRLSLVIILLLSFILGGIGIGFIVGVVKNMPEFDLTYDPDLSAFIYDRNDEVIAQLRGSENRILADFDEIPDTLKKAFLATEDIRFYDHFGIDIKAIGRAVIANIREGGYAQGSSTITMQLASNAFIGHREKKMERKIQEAILAIQLERIYTKDEIFNLYLNHINFGEGAWGVKTAAQVYFDKELNELSLSECALLAGLVQRPNTYSPFRNPDLAVNRRNTVLNLMEKYGFITSEQAAEAKKEEFVLNENRRRLQENFPWFTDYVIKEASSILEDMGIDSGQIYTAGLSIYTTMDRNVQTKLEEIYSDPSNFPESVDDVLVESAAIFLDHSTGEIIALVGGRELTTRRGLNRATDMKRQPGSTIKPIAAYGPALEAGYSPATVYDDAPIDFPDGSGKLYSPHNYDRRWRGLITMRAAIKDSINIPALKALQQVGIEKGYEFSKKLGLPLTDNDKNLSLALGGLTQGVSPLNMASAYGAFANQGILVEPHAIRKILDKDGKVIYEANPKKTVVMSEQTAYLMTDMLITVVQSGTGTRANLGRPTAGKTGTTQLPDLPEFANLRNHFRDAWFAGYTPEYTGVVWIGYDETTTKHYLKQVYGGHMPATIWKLAMQEAVKDKPVKQFNRPSNLVYTAIDAKSGLLPSELTPSQYIVNEIFTRDNVPKETSTVWVEKPICAESGLVPSDYCPDVVHGVFLQRPVPYTPPASRPNIYPEDYVLEYPSEICDLHGSDTLMTVYLCEDERHRGVPYLALMPGSDQSGGCPKHVITERKMTLDKIPTEYCNLHDHQLTVSSSGNGNESPDPIDLDPVESEEMALKLDFELVHDGNNFGILLNWNSIGTNITYNVVRWEGETKKQLGSTTRTTFLDEAVEPNKNYKYQIIAGNRLSNVINIITH